MRRGCLGLLVALPALLAGPAAAQVVDEVRTEAGVATYRDDMDTVIWSPHASAGAVVPGEVEVDVHWTADVITSASVDVVTAATPRMSETRHELGIAASREKLVADTDVDASYAYSFENDSDSHIFQAGAVRRLAQDNWELGLRYSLSLNRVGVRDQPRRDWRRMNAHGADLTLARVLGPRTLLGVGYSFYYYDGYQASPYRRVPVQLGNDLRSAMWVDEQVPDRRLRHALTARARRALGDRWVASGEYRFYFDDWGVTANTLRFDEAVELPWRLSARLEQRFGLQSQASFYQKLYTEERIYRTRDRRLSDHLSGLVGATLLRDLGELAGFGSVDAYLVGDLMLWQFSDFGVPELTSTSRATMSTLGTVVGGIIQIGVEARP